MASTESVDPYLVTALKLLHSSAPDSAEKLRTMLDNEISKNFDKSKLISGILTKKQLNDEKTAPGSGFLKKHKPKKPEDVKVLRAPSPEVIPIELDDDSSESKKSELDDSECQLDDYTCVTCREIDSSANNQLFECIECHSLHHQLCHTPAISNETNLTSWVCSACKTKKEKEGSSKSNKCYESSSSSCSSLSSSKKPKIVATPEKKSESSKKKPKESSSSSSSSRSRSSKK